MEATTPTGGGEEWRTRGLKLCPPRVLAMPRLEKGRRWRSGRRRVSVLRKINGLKGKIKENGGGGFKYGVKEGERVSPFNVHKWVLKLGLKNLE